MTPAPTVPGDSPVKPVVLPAAAPAPALARVIAPDDGSGDEPPLRVQAPLERERSSPREFPATRPPVPGYGLETLDRQEFDQELAKAAEDVRETDSVLGTSIGKVSFSFGSILSVGAVTWLLRGGALGAAVLSSVPAWRRFDPIEVVGEEDDTEDYEPSDAQLLRDRLTQMTDDMGGNLR